jgi:hypothetical protein
MKDDDPVVALFKMGKRDFMEQLLLEGVVYMNPLSWFKKTEAGESRLDPDEGLVFSKQGRGAIVEVYTQGALRPEPGDVIGQVLVGNTALDDVNVYSLHARRASACKDIIELHRFRFGDAAVVFTNFGEFLKRLTLAANREGRQIVSNLVTYVDRETHDGTMGVFRKFATRRPVDAAKQSQERAFSEESEWRAAIIPGTGKPLPLRLGNLSDIAKIIDTADRLKIVPKGAP